MNLSPKLICLTPVRNEAWVLPAFLAATSLWADYIIIADQHSTDGSREIAMSYPKVILIDNPATLMHQSNTRQLLFDEANKISGEKIIFTLDADEILSGNFLKTEGWNRIMVSQRGDIFAFRWLNLYDTLNKGVIVDTWMEWACHYGEMVVGHYPDSHIHELRLPLPEHGTWITVDDIYFVHFARLLPKRQLNKAVFYQISTIYREPHKSSISLHRMYYDKKKLNFKIVNEEVWHIYRSNGIDFQQLINANDNGQYYVDEALKMITEQGIKTFRRLDIWDVDFIKKSNLQDPRSGLQKLLHFYLRTSSAWSEGFIIKAIDKLLKLYGL